MENEAEHGIALGFSYGFLVQRYWFLRGKSIHDPLWKEPFSIPPLVKHIVDFMGPGRVLWYTHAPTGAFDRIDGMLKCESIEDFDKWYAHEEGDIEEVIAEQPH